MKLSNTNQRRVILEELRMVKTHPTADELYEIVKKRLPRISLATVYRNLDVLTEAGEVMRLHVAGKQKRYDGNPKPHHHLRCTECGAVEDLELRHTENLEHDLHQLLGGRIRSVNIEFSGLCMNCFSKKAVQ